MTERKNKTLPQQTESNQQERVQILKYVQNKINKFKEKTPGWERNTTAVLVSNAEGYLEMLSLIDNLTEKYKRNIFVGDLDKELMNMEKNGNKSALLPDGYTTTLRAMLYDMGSTPEIIGHGPTLRIIKIDHFGHIIPCSDSASEDSPHKRI